MENNLLVSTRVVEKPTENGCAETCLICGTEGTQLFETLSDSAFNFLVQSSTIFPSLSDSLKSVCHPCGVSVALMERACRVQALLAEKCRKRHLSGRNGTKTTSITAQLLKHGDGINLQKPLTSDDSDDELHLTITDIQGGLEELCSSEDTLSESCHGASEYFHTVSTDTHDLVAKGFPQLECEIFDHPDGIDVVIPDLEEDKSKIILKPPALPPDVPYNVSQWLPSTGTSERSFGSGFTEATHSSGSREARPGKRSGWNCPMCDSVFESSPLLVEHVHNAHVDMKAGENMRCPFCEKQFPTYTQLDDHITQLHGDGSHSCPGCYSVHLRASQLRRHQIHCGGYKRYQEEQKLATLGSSDNQEGGTAVVSTCSLCIVQFPSAELLSAHVKECHTDSLSKMYNCEGCKAGFNKLRALYDHQVDCMVFLGLKKTSSDSQYSVQFYCQGCKKGVGCYSEFQSHKKLCSEVKAMLDSETGNAMTAEHCHSACSLDRMMEVSSNDLSTQDITDSVAQSVRDNNPDTTSKVADPVPAALGFGTHTCPECLVLYSSQELLDIHRNVVHDDTLSYALRCVGCQGGFLTEESLTVHATRCKRIKPNGEPHRCPECLITFEFKSLLDFHMLIHKDFEKKPYRCRGCKAGFNVQIHKNTHEMKCGRVGPINTEEGDPNSNTQMDLDSQPDDKFAACNVMDGKVDGGTHAYGKIDARNGPGESVDISNSYGGNVDGSGEGVDVSIGAGEGVDVANGVVEDQTLPAALDEGSESKRDTENSQPFSCKVCSNGFSFFCDFEEHRRSCVKEPPTVEIVSRVDRNQMQFCDDPEALVGTFDLKAEKVICPICLIDLRTVSSRTYIRTVCLRHMVGHSRGIKRTQCPACSWGSNSQSRFIFTSHARKCVRLKNMCLDREFHEAQVFCPSCFLQFPSLEECSSHVITHHRASKEKWLNRFLCDACRAHHSSKGELSEHRKSCLIYARASSVVGDGPTACGICLISMSKLDSHFEEAHSIRTVLQCSVCNEVFNEVKDLITHANTTCRLSQIMLSTSMKFPMKVAELIPMHVEEMIEEETEFSDKESAISETSHRSATRGCGLCGSKNTKPSHMLIHTQSEFRPYHCQGCNAGFLSVTARGRHELCCVPLKNKNIKNKVPGLANNNLPPLANESEPEIVHNSTDTPNNIEMTIDSVSGKLSLTCPICNEIQSTHEQLASHLSLHSLTSQHRCELCLKMFDQKESFDEHKLSCGKVIEHGKVTRSQSVSTKIPTKDEDDDEAEEWKCLSCCVKFTDETSFLLHIASHEVSDVNKCFLCFASYKTAADICMHMVKYHKHYLTTGVKQGGDEDSEKDEDSDDSENDLFQLVPSSRAPSSRAPVVKAETTNQLDKSPRSLTRTKSPVRSTEPKASSSKQKTTPAASCSSTAHATDSGKQYNSSSFYHDSIAGTKCQICNRSFEDNAVLKRHYGIHDGYYPAVCLICGIGFGKTAGLRVHKARVHRTPKVNDLTCPRCNGVFEQKFRLDKHMALCICPKEEAVLQCLLCVRTFDNWHQVKSHVWTHLNKCTYCEEKFAVQSRRVEHMMACVKNPMNKGKSRVLRTKASREAPIIPPDVSSSQTVKPKPSKQTEKKYQCKDCCSVYDSLKSFRRHQATHERAEYRCGSCGGKFSSLLHKNRHMVREHRSSSKIIRAAVRPETTKTEPPPAEMIQTFFACETCDGCFHSKKEKDDHKRLVHGKASNTIAEPEKKGRVFNCKLCDKEFLSKFARRKHMNKAHAGRSSQPQNLACHVCGKRFPSNFAKLQHLKKVHGITDYNADTKKQRLCKVCGESFEHKSELRAHRRANHPQDETLDGEGRAPISLVSSESTLELKFRVCKICEMTFLHKAELKAHCRAVHGEIKMSDSAANISLIRENIFSEGNSMDACGADAANTSGGVSRLFPEIAESGERKKARVCKDCDEMFESKSELKAHRRAEHKEKKAQATMLTVTGETLQMLEGRKPTSTVVVREPPSTLAENASTSIDLTSDTEEGRPFKKFKAASPVPAVDKQNSVKVETKVPFQCKHCPKTFNLRMHLNRHHSKAHPWIP